MEYRTLAIGLSDELLLQIVSGQASIKGFQPQLIHAAVCIALSLAKQPKPPKTEWERLAAVVSERLAYFIEKSALTPEEYLESKGQDYRNTPFLQVYGRGGEPCPNKTASIGKPQFIAAAQMENDVSMLFRWIVGRGKQEATGHPQMQH